MPVSATDDRRSRRRTSAAVYPLSGDTGFLVYLDREPEPDTEQKRVSSVAKWLIAAFILLFLGVIIANASSSSAGSVFFAFALFSFIGAIFAKNNEKQEEHRRLMEQEEKIERERASADEWLA